MSEENRGTGTGEPFHILLIDDHPAVRRGLAELISCEISCRCSEAANLNECFEAIQSDAFDLAVLDISLGEESGMELIDDLSAKGIGIVVYSMFEDAETIRRALHEGCLGYVSKRESADELIACIRRVLNSETYFSPVAVCALNESSTGEGSIETILSRREMQTLDMLGQGLSRQEVSTVLGISVRTAETYCQRIVTKLNLSGIGALRKFAIDQRHRFPPSPLAERS